MEAHPGRSGLDSVNGLLDRLAGADSRYAHIDDRGTVWSNNVWLDTAIDGADVHGYAFFRIVESEQCLYDMREFEDGARAPLGVESGMGGFPVHGNGEAPDPLALGLDIALGAHRRFEHEGPLGTARQHPDVGR